MMNNYEQETALQVLDALQDSALSVRTWPETLARPPLLLHQPFSRSSALKCFDGF